MVTAGGSRLVGPGVGAVVVNFNGGDRVLRTLQALLDQGEVLEDVVAVDNNSSDGSPARIRERFPGVRLVELPTNVGLSAARNVGLGQLKTPLAIMVDHDIYVGQHCVERMRVAWLEHRPAVVCPRIILLGPGHVVQADGASLHFFGTLTLRNGYREASQLAHESGFVGGVLGGCLLLDRAKVIAAGGFDELFFFYFEDLEFSLRMRLRGERFWCEVDAEAFHEPGAGTPGLSYRGKGEYPRRRAYFTLRNRLITILVHYRWRTLLLLGPVLILYEVASLITAMRLGVVRSWARAWAWQWTNRRVLAARRRAARAARALADRDVLEGGAPPLAPGLIQSGWERALLSAFSAVVNAYWRAIRRWIG
jgi:GT2 family glycosyltransferase